MDTVDRTPLTLATDGVVGTLFTPRTPRSTHGVVLIGGSGGEEPQVSARRLAEEGFSTLSVAYFKREGLPQTLRNIPLEYFEQSLKVLRRSLGPEGGLLAVLGVSRGSEAALLTGVHFPDVANAVVGLVPGNVVLCSWPPGGPAWTLRGEGLPYVSRFGPTAEIPEAVIPVEKIRGPVLLISAGEDRVWPSAAMAAAMASRLKASNHPYLDEYVNFPQAGHWLGAGGAPAAGSGPRAASTESERSSTGGGPVLDKVCQFLDGLPRRAV